MSSRKLVFDQISLKDSVSLDMDQAAQKEKQILCWICLCVSLVKQTDVLQNNFREQFSSRNKDIFSMRLSCILAATCWETIEFKKTHGE